MGWAGPGEVWARAGPGQGLIGPWRTLLRAKAFNAKALKSFYSTILNESKNKCKEYITGRLITETSRNIRNVFERFVQYIFRDLISQRIFPKLFENSEGFGKLYYITCI